MTSGQAEAPVAESGRQRAVAGGLWIATGRLLPLVGTAVLSVSIARILGPDALGLQNYVAFVDALLATAVQWVLITVSIRRLSEARGAGDGEHLTHLVRVTFLLNVLGGLGSAGVLLTIGLTSQQPWPWVFVAAAAVCNGVAWGFAVAIIAEHGWMPVARVRLVTQLAAVILGFGAVLAGLGIAGVFAAAALASAVFAVIMRARQGPVAWGRVRPIPSGLLEVWLRLLALEILVQWVSQKSGVLFLQRWADHAEIAMFSVAFMVVATAAALPVAMAISGLPSVANSLGAGTIKATLARLGQPVRIAIMVSVPLAAFVASVGPPAVVAFYGEEFHQAAVLVPIQALALLSATAGMVCVTFWIGAGQLRPPAVAAAAGVAVNIATALALVPGFGAWGAVISSVAGQTTMAAVILWWTHRLGGRIEVPIAQWVSLMVAAGMWTAAMAALGRAIGVETAAQRWWGLGLIGLSTAVALALLGAAVGYTSRRDQAWLLDSLPGVLKPWGRFLVGPQRLVGPQPKE